MDRPERHGPVRRSYDTVAEKYAAGFQDELAAKPLDRARAGFAVTARLERTSYPGEVETRRGYLLARRAD